MRSCSNCEKAGRSSRCKLGDWLDKCLECVRLGYGCDLAPFDPAKWRRLETTRKPLKQEASDALAKYTRLQRQIEFLEDEKREMMESELLNLEELEQKERSERPSNILANSLSDNFLVDVRSEQLEIPPDLDWLTGSLSGTAAEASGSS